MFILPQFLLFDMYIIRHARVRNSILKIYGTVLPTQKKQSQYNKVCGHNSELLPTIVVKFGLALDSARSPWGSNSRLGKQTRLDSEKLYI